MIHHSYCTSIAPGEPPAASRRSPPPAHPGLAGCKSSRARWVAQGDTPASQAGHHLTGGALAGMSSRVLLESRAAGITHFLQVQWIADWASQRGRN
jgi:hypothetical protein